MVISGVNTKTGRSVMPEKKKRTLGAKINPDARTGRTMASAARSAAYLRLQAGRRATAKRLSGQKATTQAQLDARKIPVKPKPGGLRGLIGSWLGMRSELEGALKPKPEKKKP
jgi:hypothetical protein